MAFKIHKYHVVAGTIRLQWVALQVVVCRLPSILRLDRSRMTFHPPKMRPAHPVSQKEGKKTVISAHDVYADSLRDRTGRRCVTALAHDAEQTSSASPTTGMLHKKRSLTPKILCQSSNLNLCTDDVTNVEPSVPLKKDISSEQLPASVVEAVTMRHPNSVYEKILKSENDTAHHVDGGLGSLHTRLVTISDTVSHNTLAAVTPSTYTPAVGYALTFLDSSTTAATTISPQQDNEPAEYIDIGDCSHVCSYCDATFWYGERVKDDSKYKIPVYHGCCSGGKIRLPSETDPPLDYKDLLQQRHFLDNIRAYNQMFAMTSFGAKVDESINNGRAPYVFKLSGQIYHWIGSLCPPKGDPPRFLQLYIHDTENEVSNRLRPFSTGKGKRDLQSDVVERLMNLLNTHNELIRLFRTARDKCDANVIPDFKIRLFSVPAVRGYELPSSDALGAIVFDADSSTATDYDVIIESTGGLPQRIHKLHPSYMSLQFPLLFFYGQNGYFPVLKMRKSFFGPEGKRLSMNAYYSYQLHERCNRFNLLFRSGRLFQQYMVSVYCCIEQNRMDYLRANQNTIRRDYLSGIYDALSKGDREGSDVGSRVILPSSFTGGPRYMYSHYLDALAICRTLGNPQFFITFTCNVRWPEIRRHMASYPYLSPNDRADIISRVFQQKVVLFIKYLKKQKPFGTVSGVLYTIEFQKRGLPHCHTLLWLDASSKIKDAEDVDQFISAEILNPATDPDGYRVVSEFMLHGPCGSIKYDAPCMQDGRYSKTFPKKYNPNSYFDNDGHIHYRRREQGITVTKQSIKLDNAYVVPYNRRLCLAFNAHINVEYCGWSMLIKYLFKYISKGTDRIVATISRPIGDSTTSEPTSKQHVDEIQTFIDGRFICPHEASWRILNYNIHHRDPAVQILSVHLDDMQTIQFKSKDDLRVIASDTYKKKTTLTEWLRYNCENSDGRCITYLHFPNHFVWRADSKCWAPRKNTKKNSIGRIAYVHPASGELFYLRLLLCHQKGCCSFKDIRSVNQMLHHTYRAACNSLGLLGDDNEWEIAMTEASISCTSSELRRLFVQLMVYCDVTRPDKLFTDHWRQMSEDVPLRISKTMNLPNIQISSEDLKGYTLYELESIFNTYGKSLQDYGLPLPPALLLSYLSNRLLMEETSYDRDGLTEEAFNLIPRLNNEQRKVYDLTIDTVSNKQQQLMFVYGHGGTGKTFLWTTIISSLRAKGNIVLAVASSGIASLLLPSGRTAHSRFKLPLDLTNESLCRITKNTNMANLLKQTDLIIWDEAPMNDRMCFETLDRTLKDILDNPHLLFGGKFVILGGDFRQTLPIKKNASKAEIIASSISESHLWVNFKLCILKENMRLSKPGLNIDDRNKAAHFASWLLDIGNGHLGTPSEEPDTMWVSIPEELCIRDDEFGLTNLINFIYEPQTLHNPTAEKLQNKAIVCPRNDTADVINTQVSRHIVLS